MSVKLAKGAINVVTNFYDGAVKGIPKAHTTVNRALKKAPKIVPSKGLPTTLHSKTRATVRGNGRMTHRTNATMSHKTGDFFGGGIRDSVKNMTPTNKGGKGMKFGDSVKQAHMKVGADGKPELSMGRVTGTAMTIGVAGRIASGGGLYKDRYGNTNLPGVPFI